MPPHQTNVTPEIGRDAAGPYLDLTMPLVKDAPGIASPEMCPDASIALRDASPEKQAAEPPGTSTRNVLRALRGYWRAFGARRQGESLHNLSDRALRDIGLTRSDIDHLTARGAVERLRDGTTWLSRGL